MVIFTLYGYIGMATFYLVSQWLAQYGQFVVGLPYASAIKLLSIYTVGSLVCVFVTAAFVKEVFSSAIAMIEYANALVMLEGDKKMKEATKLYEQAAACEPADAMERLDVEMARAELEEE